jgi:hypothetical protein
MTNDLTTRQPGHLTHLAQLGEVANAVAADSVFADYLLTQIRKVQSQNQYGLGFANSINIRVKIGHFNSLKSDFL